MKFLLLGASGQVGTELRRRLPAVGELTCATRTGLLDDGSPCLRIDFDSSQTLGSLVDRVAPDVVVNAAAYTAVDRAEDDAAAAFRVNAEAPGVLADQVMEQGAQLWGLWSNKGYEFEDSKARVEEFFLSCGMDQEGQADATPGRVKAWVAQTMIDFGV